MTETAFRTSNPEVIAAWEKYLTDTNEVALKRAALVERKDPRRGLMVESYGFSHGTHVVGFERLDEDRDGDVFGSIRVSSSRGRYKGIVIPNLGLKDGRDLADELRTLDSPRLDLPGIPSFHLGGGGGPGIARSAPALWLCESPADHVLHLRAQRALYAHWPVEGVPVDLTLWESIPLSTYYLAKENFS